MRTLLMLLVVLCAAVTSAKELSVEPLAAALRHPHLHDAPDETARAEAQAAVLQMFLNQPRESERQGVADRLAAISEHQGTRLGRMFFAMLESAPGLENLPESATDAELIVHWPLALGAEARLRVRWELHDDAWRVSVWTMQLRGAAAAPVSAAAPYFGDEPFNAAPGDAVALLDAPELDYLLGRNPLTRDDPDAPEFDEAAALSRYFAAGEGAVGEVWDKLAEAVTPQATSEARAAALRPHLFDDAQREALERANSDPDARDEFWRRVMEHLATGKAAARPDSLPSRAGSRVTWAVTTRDNGAIVRYTGEALRLSGGNVAPRITRSTEPKHDG